MNSLVPPIHFQNNPNIEIVDDSWFPYGGIVLARNKLTGIQCAFISGIADRWIWAGNIRLHHNYILEKGNPLYIERAFPIFPASIDASKYMTGSDVLDDYTTWSIT